jgi:hypothetical protein
MKIARIMKIGIIEKLANLTCLVEMWLINNISMLFGFTFIDYRENYRLNVHTVPRPPGDKKYGEVNEIR